MHSLSAKLIAGLVASLAGVLFWLGAANLRVLRENLETTVVMTEQRMADLVLRSTRESMLRNDRTDQIQIIESLAAQPDVRKIRIIAGTGTIQVSTVPGEVGRPVGRSAGAGNGIYRIGQERVIGSIRPIENEPACSNAACHAHPPSQRTLGELEVVVSLESVDRALAAHERRMRAQVAFSAALMMGIAGFLIWFLISRPIRRLIAGVKVLAARNLAYRFGFGRRDEIGELAGAFDNMAAELEGVNRTLEERIQRKTKELEAAQESLIHSEKLASLGELSAAVAHEINNPLAGIFTYARLLEKKLAPAKPVLDWIQTIQHESKRCGEIVNNLLVFARKHQTELSHIQVNTIVQRTLAVVQHNLEMHGIAFSCRIAELPPLYCDASQIQQVLTAIIMNAVDAMSAAEPKGGILELQAAPAAEGWIDISLANNGPPIPKDVLPHIFEPFFSTKPAASGVGLGLAVAYGIVKRHGGEIRVETGAKTAFHVLLPLAEPAQPQPIREELDVPAEIVHSNSR